MAGDRVGNTLKAAKSLGSLGVGSKPSTYKETVGVADGHDLYRFSVKSSGSYTLNLAASKKGIAGVRVFSLKGLPKKVLKKFGSIDFKVLKPRIIKKKFLTLGQSAFDRRTPANLSLNLAPGDYYIQIFQRKKETAYQLELSRLVPSAQTVRQVSPLFIKQAGGKDNDYVYGTTIDAQGNLYTIGRTAIGKVKGSVVSSYNANGELLWQRQLSLPGTHVGFDIAVDSVGSYYVAGTANISGTKSDGYVAKYDSAGTLLWQQIIAGAPVGTDAPTEAASGIALDSAGNVFVSGFWNLNPAIGQFGNAFVGKLNGSTGAPVAEFGSGGLVEIGGAGADAASGLAIDAEGNVYVTGITDAAIGFSTKKPYVDGNAFVARLNGVSGATLWNQTLAGDVGQDYARGIGLDGAGNVYITGQTQGTLPSGSLSANEKAGKAGDFDGFVAKYGKGGDRIWVRQFGTTGLDESQAIAVDPSGRIYLTGETTKGLLGGMAMGKSDAWLVTLDTNGELLAGSQVGTVKDDETYGVAIDAIGNLYITGQTYSAFAGATNAGKYDTWIAKYTYPL